MNAGLTDRFGRRIDYLRLSVTDRCDLRCHYCIPEGFCGFAPAADRLTAAEIGRVVAAFAALGVRRVRLTGGEPLTRSDLPEIARRIAAIDGIDDLSVSTNGTRLAQRAAALRNAGVTRLNVSLDTLRRKRFRSLTGRDALDAVLAGLEAARTIGFAPIKLNTVLLPETEDSEIDEIVNFARNAGFILRLIEAMPVGAGGIACGFRPLTQAMQRLAQRHQLVPGLVPGGGPARYLVSGDGAFSIGFIAARSQHFCQSCNRVRVTANGRLLLCLGDEAGADLGRVQGGGGSDTDRGDTTRAAILDKPWGHEFETRSSKLVRVMAQTGG